MDPTQNDETSFHVKCQIFAIYATRCIFSSTKVTKSTLAFHFIGGRLDALNGVIEVMRVSTGPARPE